MKGRYIAFEGIDGAGKSSVAMAVGDHLRADGLEVENVREPGGTRVGEAIRQILLHSEGHLEPWTEALLFAAARAQLAHEVVAPLLAAGTWVISDRSVYSSLAYQGGARGLGVEVVRQVNSAGLGDVWPDLVVLLELAPAAGLDRQRVPDRIGGEGVALQELVASTYDQLAAAPYFTRVDAARSLDEVVEDSLDAVRSLNT